MKRMLPLFLLLAAGQAQADSNSDYRAGSDFAHQIKGGAPAVSGILILRRVFPAITRIRMKRSITVV